MQSLAQFLNLYTSFDSDARSPKNPSGVKMCDDPTMTSHPGLAAVTSYAHLISE